jgi:uncharacterized protein YndB with AHSA1/START domain
MDSIEREIVIAAPPERVYAIVSEPEHIAQWFGDAGAERHGDVITVRWASDSSAELRVVKEDPPHAFSYRWDSTVRVGDTLVEFTFEPAGDGTRLKVVESGWESLATTPEEQQRLRESNRGGWERELGELERYAATISV